MSIVAGYGYVIGRSELNRIFRDSSCVAIEKELESGTFKLPKGIEYYWRNDTSLLVCIPNHILNAVMAGIRPPTDVSELNAWLKVNQIKTQDTIGLCY